MRRLTKNEWTFLAVVAVYSFIPAILGLFRIPELVGGPTIMPPNPRAVIDPVPIILHILASSIFCLAGAVQFLPSVRRDRPAVHRGLGRVVVAAGAISALAGLWMTVFYVFPPALQGPLLYWARVFLSLAMFAFLFRAVIALRARNVAAHRAAMLRSYAIGQGASTQTALFIVAMAFSGVEPLDLFRELIMVAAWVLNLLTAEFVIRRTVATPRFSVAVSRRSQSQD
ncbi:DUF2306 domain-containing protein [Primorskyibacter sp. S187A]|uniref:DUF2306 domain-containing protein n=1 Tax=Primorskyibacter sp. S187A TaxID=3415130 RepID=UPI003C7CEC5A